MNLQEYRIERIKKEAKKAGVSAVIATSSVNVRYLTGYCGMLENFQYESFCYVLYDVEKEAFIYMTGLGEVPTLLEFDEQAQIFTAGSLSYEYTNGDSFSERIVDLRQKRHPSLTRALAAAINTISGTVALDESCMNYVNYQAVIEHVKENRVVPAYDIFMKARRVKHADEIQELRTSVMIAENALKKALKDVEAGVTTERYIEQQYNKWVIESGALPLFFVGASGKRSAYCDTVCRNRVIERDDIIRFDFGCIINGYRSDIARTAVVGEPSAKLLAYYHAVKAGTQEAIAAIRPGVTAAELYRTAMDAVRREGIPSYKRAHCGHGIGLEMYDFPSVSEGDDTRMEENMVLCIETPYYELGWGGVQVEDTVVVTSSGSDYLAPPSAELIVL